MRSRWSLAVRDAEGRIYDLMRRRRKRRGLRPYITFKRSSGEDRVSSKETSKESILPFEIITQILCRLPVESVLRCKSVCKSWNYLIQEQFFVRLHLSKSPVCNLPLRYFSGDVYCDGLVYDGRCVWNPSLRRKFYLPPYYGESPVFCTMFHAPSSGCYKLCYNFYHGKKDDPGKEFIWLRIHTIGVDSEWRILDIPELQNFYKTDDTFWFMELFMGHVFHVAKIRKDRSDDCSMISIDLDSEMCVVNTTFPSRMFGNFEKIVMASCKDEYPTIRAIMKGELEVVVLRDRRKGLSNKSIVFLDYIEQNLISRRDNPNLYDSEEADDMDYFTNIAMFTAEGVSNRYCFQRSYYQSTYTLKIESHCRKHRYPSLLTFEDFYEDCDKNYDWYVRSSLSS